jgi:hypothetical protein
LVINLPIIGLLIKGNFNQNILYTMVAFVCSMATLIIIVPALTKLDFLNRHLDWMSALTKEQKDLILSFKLPKHNEIPRTTNYFRRVKPYLMNIAICSVASGLLGMFDIMNSYVSIFFGALSFYCTGVYITIAITLPIFSSQ